MRRVSRTAGLSTSAVRRGTPPETSEEVEQYLRRLPAAFLGEEVAAIERFAARELHDSVAHAPAPLM
jgi:hypothetical protein